MAGLPRGSWLVAGEGYGSLRWALGAILPMLPRPGELKVLRQRIIGAVAVLENGRRNQQSACAKGVRGQAKPRGRRAERGKEVGRGGEGG